MLRGLTLRTKLGALIALGVAAVLAAGAIGGWNRIHDRRAADEQSGVVRAGRRAGDLLARVETEATASSWYLASGDRTARSRLAAARPLTDRAARALWETLPIQADGTTVDATVVRGQWDDLRAARAAIDRRVVGDFATLERFARLETTTHAVVERLADAATGDAAPPLEQAAGLAALESAIASEQSTVTTALARGRVSPSLRERARTERAHQADAIEAAPAGAASMTRLARDLGVLVDAGAASAVPIPEWLQVTDRELTSVRARARALRHVAASRAATARSEVRSSGIGAALAIGGIALALIAAGMLLARAVRRPIRDLADTARRAVERRAGPAPATDAPEPPAVASADEVGAAARALHDLDQLVVDRLRRDSRWNGPEATPLSVDLARRNQPLLERQRGLIAELAESGIPPERVQTLRVIDALATRMYRNTDCVLVVAGMETPRESAPPRPLRDLVREAIVDVAEFVDVEVVGLPDRVEIAHDAGDDVEHILAELLANAARASTEGTPVHVSARWAGERLELSVTDEGGGMPVSRLDALNEVLTHPPLPGFDRPLSFGLVAVARRAERIGATVALRSATQLGTVATLSLPARILGTAPDRAGPDPDADGWTTAEGEAPVVEEPVVEEPVAAAPDAEPTAAAPVAAAPEAVEIGGPLPPPVAVELMQTPPGLRTIPVAEHEAPGLVRFTPVPVTGGHDLLPSPGRRRGLRRPWETHRPTARPASPASGPNPSVEFARVDRRSERSQRR